MDSQGNPDSESISEEDEDHINISLAENDKLPNENAKEEGGLLLQTKLEELIGCGEINYPGKSGDESLEATIGKISSSLEDDVEVPDSPDQNHFVSSRRAELTCISVQESGSDDEIPHDEQVGTWSAINKVIKSHIHLNGIASSSSHLTAFRANRGSSKVVKDHLRTKFSFHSHTHGEMSFKISDMAEIFESAAEQAIEEDPITDCPYEFDERSENSQGIAVAKSRDVPHQWTEDAIPKPSNVPADKSRMVKRNYKPYSRRVAKSLKFTHKGSSSNLQNSATDDELPGPMDIGSSSDDEPSCQRSVHNISNQEKQFVGDRFDEAIKASSLNKEGLLFGSPKLSGGSSLYGKLQQIMKQEKETEMEIMKRLQGGIEQADSSSYVDVKIMSRHLEGKLVVCKCSVIDLSVDSRLFKNTQAKETETTIIFCPKLCADVDIEIGNFIRLHAPWNEMEMKNTNEMIILASYFSRL